MKYCVENTVKYLILIFISINGLTCCTPRRTGPASQITLKGINDSAVYSILPGKGVSMIFKKEYTTPAGVLAIKRDTIQIGDSVSLYLLGSKSGLDISVDLEEPAKISIKKEESPVIFKYKPIETGKFHIKGNIRLDTTNFPFVYNFLVVDED